MAIRLSAKWYCHGSKEIHKTSKACLCLVEGEGSHLHSFFGWLTADGRLGGWPCTQCHRHSTLLRSLGFIIHPEKSVLRLTPSIEYLGVIIDTIAMSVTVTQEKKDNLKACCSHLLQRHTMKIREVAKVIGLIVSSFPAVKYGQLHYRQLENDKKVALAASRGHYDSDMCLSTSAKDEPHWWIEVIQDAANDILVSEPEEIVISDASNIAWGCEFQETRTGGAWLPAKSQFHISYLELKAASFALQCFLTQIGGINAVRLRIDSSTAVAVINNMGTSHSHSCNSPAFTIWEWCIKRQIWLSAAHIPGKENTTADSRVQKS